MAGLPEQVRTDLHKNPDFAVANLTKWERHIIHRLQLEQDAVDQKKRELEEAQTHLVKLQLAEARQKLNDKKKDTKEEVKKMMVARPSVDLVLDWPDLDPNLNPDDRWPGHGPRQLESTGGVGVFKCFNMCVYFWQTGELPRHGSPSTPAPSMTRPPKRPKHWRGDNVWLCCGYAVTMRQVRIVKGEIDPLTAGVVTGIR